MKMLNFKALLPVSVDIEFIWKSISYKEFTHLGGEGGKYTVMQNGPIKEGLETLNIILQQTEDHEVSLRTFDGGEENVEEEKVEEEIGEAPSDSV